MQIMVQFSDLIGLTISKIGQDRAELLFTCTNGAIYKLYHPISYTIIKIAARLF